MHANLHTRNRDWSCTDGQQATRRWCFHQGDPHGGGGGDHDEDDYRGHLQEDEDAFRTFAVYCGLALHHAKLYDKIRRSEQKYKVMITMMMTTMMMMLVVGNDDVYDDQIPNTNTKFKRLDEVNFNNPNVRWHWKCSHITMQHL